MQELLLGSSQLAALIAREPWQAFAATLVIILVVIKLLARNTPRDSGGDLDLSLLGGDGDGGDGGGD